MENNNGKGQNVLYLVVGIATLVVAIIGATFAYFSAAATADGDDIEGATENNLAGALSLTVSRIDFEGATANTTNLVPAEIDTTSADTVNLAIEKNCEDKGYTGCHLYRITASSTQDLANASVRLTSLTTDAEDTDSWKYVIYKNSGDTTSGDEEPTVTVNYNAESLVANGASDFATFEATYTGEDKNGFDMHNNAAMTANTPVYYYLLVYLANKDAVQNPEEVNEDSGTGSYTGEVSMDVLGGKVVASFSATA